MKKLAAAALVAAMVLSLAGCGSSTKKIESKDDLKDAVIGVQLGTTGDTTVSEPSVGAKEVKRYNKGAQAIQALKKGQIDCVVIDTEPAKKFVELNDDLKMIEDQFDDEQYAISMKKGNTELKDAFNKALGELEEEGVLSDIINNYIGDEAGKNPYESPADADRSKGKLVMATNAEFEPWEYHDGESIVGIDVDIAQAICDKLGYELEVSDMEFDAILPAVQSGKADFGAAGMTVNEERLESVDFTDTYANASQVIIVKK